MQIGSVKCADVFFFRSQGMWFIWSLTLTDHRHPVFCSDLIVQCVWYAVRYAGLHLDWKGIWLCTRTVFFMQIQSTLLRLWLLCIMSIIILVNQLLAFRATWGHIRGYLMRNIKLETAIICGDAAIIYIYIYIYMICKRMVGNILKDPEIVCIQINGFKCCYLTLMIQFNMNYLFADS